MRLRGVLICPVFLLLIQAAGTVDVNDRTTTLASALPLKSALIEKIPSNDQKTTIEGSGASLDDYEDEDEQLAKVTATTSTTLSTSKRSTIASSTKAHNSTNNDELDDNEFKEDFADDLEDIAYDHELTSLDSTVLPPSTTRTPTTAQNPSPARVFFGFLTRPPIAAGILVGKCTRVRRQVCELSLLGLSVGILISVGLLICIVRRLQKREKSPSSFTAGLLYPNRYGYSKSPQEFYA